ncbi:energy transducer TonB [Hydrogenobaculum acidophilum]
MSLYKDYVFSFFLSLAFWLILIFVFSLSLKTPKPHYSTILILKAPKVVENEKTQIPKPIKQTMPKPKTTTPSKPSRKPLQQYAKSISKPQNQAHPTPNTTLQNTKNVENKPIVSQNSLSLPSKAPSNVPSLPSKPQKGNGSSDYFKNAYTPPRAIYKPKPHIPQSLLPDVREILLRVRFYIKKDGSAKAVLLNPTPNPSLNAILQKELSSWKFFPATKDQKPVNSTLDMEIKIRIE